MDGHSHKITFDNAERRYKLVRDWQENPPTASEVEALYVNLGLSTFLFRDFCRQFAEGRLIVAPDLSEVERGDTDRFLQDVAELMQTTNTAAEVMPTPTTVGAA
jgi:hypothetical protein